MSSYSNLNSSDLVDKLLDLNITLDNLKDEIADIKAELETRGCRVMDDRKIRFVEYSGSKGLASITDAYSLEVLNDLLLQEVLGEGIVEMHIKKETKVAYKYSTSLTNALQAIYTDDYNLTDSLEDFLQDAFKDVLDTKKQALLLRKLKGDYKKDLDTLRSVVPDRKDDAFEEELYYIHQILNGKLIKALLPEDTVEKIKQIKNIILVDIKTSLKTKCLNSTND